MSVAQPKPNLLTPGPPIGEPSMEDIIASIGRIIAEDSRSTAAIRPVRGEIGEILELTEVIEADGSVRHLAPVAVPAPSPPPATPPPASPTPTPVQAAPTYAPPPPQQPGPGSDADQRFLALASQIPGITITEPEAGTTSARAVCRGLRGGKTPAEEAVATANNTGLTPEHAAALVTAAITVYCPRYGG